MAKDEYITLKEASELTGYAADYIGQLIRSGKIHGKQIYYNVAWVTTEAAVQEYLEKGVSNKNNVIKEAGTKINKLKLSIAQKAEAHKAFKWLLYAIMTLSILVFLFLFYILSVHINDKIEDRAQQSIEEQALIQSLQEKPTYNTL